MISAMAVSSRLLNVGKDIGRAHDQGRANGQPANRSIVALLSVHVAEAAKHDGNEGDGFSEWPDNESGDGIEQALAWHTGCALDEKQI